jgi:hypothetical protein
MVPGHLETSTTAKTIGNDDFVLTDYTVDESDRSSEGRPLSRNSSQPGAYPT